jgi:hypothetical protein
VGQIGTASRQHVVTSYGIASAVGANGKRYWVLELGN